MGGGKAPRNSSLELLRILAMMAIIAHHYVVNSTVVSHFSIDQPKPQQEFLLMWGMWGKSAINSFILISGYFLCTMQLTLRRYMKLLVEVLFYGLLIMAIFSLTGYQAAGATDYLRKAFRLFIGINHGFTASFMAFYAFVPFYNKLINACTKQELGWLVLGLLFVFTICGTVFGAPVMHEPVWYMVLYFVAAYLRLYPNRFTSSLKWSVAMLVGGVALSYASVYVIYHHAIATHNIWFLEKLMTYQMVSDSNKLLAFVVGTSAFLVAVNIKPFYSNTINFLAAGTFGVLLIHASSDTMRQWLWQDVCRVPEMLHAPLSTLVYQAIAVPIGVFLICSLIDALRRQFIEKPLFSRRPKPAPDAA